MESLKAHEVPLAKRFNWLTPLFMHILIQRNKAQSRLVFIFRAEYLPELFLEQIGDVKVSVQEAE